MLVIDLGTKSQSRRSLVSILGLLSFLYFILYNLGNLGVVCSYYQEQACAVSMTSPVHLIFSVPRRGRWLCNINMLVVTDKHLMQILVFTDNSRHGRRVKVVDYIYLLPSPNNVMQVMRGYTPKPSPNLYIVWQE